MDEHDILEKNAIYLCTEAMSYGCIFEYSRGVIKHRGDLVSHELCTLNNDKVLQIREVSNVFH